MNKIGAAEVRRGVEWLVVAAATAMQSCIVLGEYAQWRSIIGIECAHQLTHGVLANSELSFQIYDRR